MKVKQKIKFRVYYFSTKIYESDLSDESLINLKTIFGMLNRIIMELHFWDIQIILQIKKYKLKR